METQSRPRPSLRPVWTGQQHDARRNSPEGYSPQPPSLDSLPSPVYPASSAYDYSMRQHERAMIERLEAPRHAEAHRYLDPPSTVSPTSDRRMSLRRASVASYVVPSAPAPSPSSPSLMPTPARRLTLVDEARSILLAGLSNETQAPADNESPVDRRQSLPPSFPVARRSSQHRELLHRELQAWGHVYLGNALSATCFVAAHALRRPSETPTTPDGARERSPGHASKRTLRVRIRPRDLNRQPFLLTRTVDVDEIRATFAELSPVSPSPPTPRRVSEDPRGDLNRRNGRSPNSQRPWAKGGAEHRSERRSPTSNTPVPIHLRYACAYFPLLASIIFSGHIRRRDIVDLPLPHPQAWAQTVAYVYTGQGELTEAIRENILYLGGNA